MNVIFETTKQTINRGIRKFIISLDKGRYFAHEIGEATQWAKVTGKEQLKAHRLNPSRRRGNQYGIFWKPVGFKMVVQAKQAIQEHSQKHITYC